MEKEFKMINYIKYKKKIASFCTKFRSKIDKKRQNFESTPKKTFPILIASRKEFHGLSDGIQD